MKNINYFYKHLPHYYNLIKNIKGRRFKIVNDNILDLETGSYFYPIENGKSLMEQISELYANNPMKNHMWEKFFLMKELPHYDEKILPITSKICNEIVDIAKKSDNFTMDY